MKLLLIEDDREAAAYLVKGLTESGHVVDHAADGDDGLHLALTGDYDALIVCCPSAYRKHKRAFPPSREVSKIPK